MSESKLINGVTANPMNKNATEEAKNLMKFLAQNYGKKIISGQMDLAWDDSIDMAERVHSDTGKYPLLMGFDFMNYSFKSGSGTHQVEEAIEWWNKGGIVTFCWHWHVPTDDGKMNFYTPSACKFGSGTNFKIPYDEKSEKWETEKPEYQ